MHSVLIQRLKGLINIGGIALFILGVVFLHSAISQENSQTFCDPTIQGYRLDWCLHWAAQCGEPAANAWCREKGYERATQWNEAVDIGASSPTYIMGDGKVCDQQFCNGFSMVECTGATVREGLNSRLLTRPPRLNVIKTQPEVPSISSTPGGTPKRTVLPDGTVEIRYPDGTVKLLYKGGGGRIIHPDGSTTPIYVPFVDVISLNPPALPSGEQNAWFEAHSESLLGIIRSLVSNDQTAVDNYLKSENTDNPYEKIKKRTDMIRTLTSP